MRKITSRHNALFKQWRRLATQQRSSQSQLLLEGVHLCSAWLEHFGLPTAVIVAETAQEQDSIQWLLQSLRQQGTMKGECPLLNLALTQSQAQAQARAQAHIQAHSRAHSQAQAPMQAKDLPCYVLPTALFNELSDVVSPQGVFFLVERPSAPWPEGIEQTCLLLDRIQDPGNLGTILRTAAALDISQVFLTSGTVNPWSAKVLRSGQGAHFHLAIFEQVALEQWFEAVKIPLAVTVLEGGQGLYQAALQGPIAWAFGNESRGVSEALVHRAEHPLTIEHGPQVESLNVAVAAAVCLFEHRRQNMG